MLYKNLTGQIIESFYKVYNQLGYGFLEKVYENALHKKLRKQGLECTSQIPIKVYYEGAVVGEYFADLIVNEKIVVELKASENLTKANEIQLINYLKATNLEVGLLFNFGKQPQFRRKIFTNK